MSEASPALRASQAGAADLKDAPRRLRRSAAPILDPGGPDPRWNGVAGTEERALQPNQGTLERVASFRAIRAAAELGRFLSYGDVAAASGLAWNIARRRMDPHLFALCQWAMAQGWPLLSAIVVNKPSVAHGAMRGRPLIGFTRAAERCGRITGGDAVAFLAAEQRRVFEWAEKERGHDLHA